MIRFKRSFKLIFGDGDDAPPAPPPAPPPAKVFAQADIDRIVQERIATENKRFAKERSELLEQVKNLTQDAEKKKEYEAKLEEIRVAGLTKEEQLKDSNAKLQREFESKLKAEQEKSDRMFRTYAEEKVLRELSDAAARHEAYSNAQIVEILQSKARLIEETGPDGKPMGRHAVRVKHVRTDGDGKAVTLDLTPEEAVKAMKDDAARFGNLFKANLAGGLGASPKPGGRTEDLENLDQSEFTKRFLTNRRSVMPK